MVCELQYGRVLWHDLKCFILAHKKYRHSLAHFRFGSRRFDSTVRREQRPVQHLNQVLYRRVLTGVLSQAAPHVTCLDAATQSRRLSNPPYNDRSTEQERCGDEMRPGDAMASASASAQSPFTVNILLI
jgi:hypothetical protein